MASPDLAAVNADELSFACDVSLSAEDFSQLTAELGGKPLYNELPFVFGANYTKGGQRQRELAMLKRGKRGRDEYALTFHCTVGREGRLPRALKRPYFFLQTLAPFGLKATFKCAGKFQYSDTDWEPVIALPLRFVQWPALPFDELRGVRAVKLEGDNLTYSVILDRPDNEKYLHSLMFEYDATIGPTLVEEVLAEAARISLLFIRRGSDQKAQEKSQNAGQV
jgi:hypothetical protein